MNKWCSNICLYILVFCATVFMAFAMLILAAYLPQDPIDENVRTSAYILKNEGNYLTSADGSDGTIFDNFTEAFIMMTSKATSKESLSYTLRNPIYQYEDSIEGVGHLWDYVNDPNPVPAWYYARYWMGFRIIIRPLLTVMHYGQIRQCIAFAFFLLFAVLIADIARRLDIKTAAAFAVSIIFVKPNVICNSMQFSSCFFIAFLAMLLVPCLTHKKQFDGLFFMEVGMLTMYFDFYTTPALTFGMPMVYLYLLRAKENSANSAGSVMKNAGIWMAGYGLMWIAKLLLAQLLTTEETLKNGARSLFHNTARKVDDYWGMLLDVYNKIKLTVIADEAWCNVFSVGILVLIILILWRIWKRTASFRIVWERVPLLLIAIMPLLWFVIAARPLVNHYYFQYRSIAVFFWAVGAYCCILWNAGGNKKAQ